MRNNIKVVAAYSTTMLLATAVLLTITLISITNTKAQDDNDLFWGGLYPRESISRELFRLDGIWDFRLAPLHDPDQGFIEEWYKSPLSLTGDVLKMPVPCSYNEITQLKSVRDHIGWAWYDHKFFVPKRWSEDNKRVVVRIGSAHYNTIVYLNGEEVIIHEGGHLPMMADITNYVTYGHENLITVCVNNTLTPDTIPQGQIVHHGNIDLYPPDYFEQKLNFDFFNYAGIHRSVFIYTTPQTYLEDITINTDINGTTGIVNYELVVDSSSGSVEESICTIKVYDKYDTHLGSVSGCSGTFQIPNANFWWPVYMSDDPGYMYKMQITIQDELGIMDDYPQKFGIRKLAWNSSVITINGKPIYMYGFGKHEDEDIHGKGLNFVSLTKDFNLMEWLGSNSLRTSHYPYSEEFMDMADEQGIMVVDESPAIGLSGFGEPLLELHASIMKELIQRDKNRPSVIIWSVGNEPRSEQAAAEDYFGNISAVVRATDSTRPVTCVISTSLSTDKAGASFDVILINRYYSWYGDTGHLEVIKKQTIAEVTNWHIKHSVPIMISEYGAGALSGIHLQPSFTWSEEYQVDLLLHNFEAFDELIRTGFFFGEMVWNFSDFATPQETNRPPGCMKGVFTRRRQPKMAARVLKKRYMDLSQRLYNNSKVLKVNKNEINKIMC